MKNITIALILVATLIFSFSSCTTNANNENTSNSNELETNSTYENSEQSTGNSTGAMGNADGKETFILLNSDNALSISEQSELSLPLVSFPYSTSETNGNETLQMVQNDLKDFLVLENLDYNSYEWKEDTEAYALSTYKDGVGINTSPKYILFSTTADSFSAGTTENELIQIFENTTTLNNMCTFLGITNKAYSFTSRKHNDGVCVLTLYAYQQGNSLSENIFNCCTKYVKLNVIVGNSTNYVSYGCYFPDNTSTLSVSGALTFTQAAEEANININTELIYCSIKFYSNYNEGYLTPCYEFIVDSGTKSDSNETIIYKEVVPMYTVNEAE